MPSARSSSAVRPSSPLSPGFQSASRYDHSMLQPPAPRPFSPRSNNASQLRQKATSLMLPALPRFHPANFPSNHSSIANTPGSGPTSPQMENSPVMQQRLYSDAQKQLFLYQRETVIGRSMQHNNQKPTSPKLEPLGSPGPVTPLELESGDDYLAARGRSGTQSAFAEHSENLAEKLIHAASQRESSPRPTTPSRG